MGGFLGREQRGIGSEREVNTGEPRNKLGEYDNNCSAGTYGTKLVWNSFKSTFNEPSKRSEAVMDETTWATSLLRLEKLGDTTFSLLLQMS